MLSQAEVRSVLTEVAGRYPADMVDEQLKDVVRIGFNIGLALRAARGVAPSELEICDLGGGVGLFSVGCAALGLKRTVLVDDFGDAVSRREGPSVLDLHRRYGVEILSRDVVAGGLRGIDGAFDVVTTFDSMEHWHHSPKRLFGEVVEKLKPGGAFVLGVPNCVNLRKRITVPFGAGAWTRIEDWYDAEVFRGHVREPDVSDLRYIARDLGLVDVEIVGRNWAGYASRSRLVRLATRLSDHPLRLRPSLCADIYLVGRKP